MNARKLTLATAFALTVAQAASAQVTILTSRPGGDAIDWVQLNILPDNVLQIPQSFESFGGVDGSINQEETTSVIMQCCSPRFGGIYDGNFAQGDWLIESSQITLRFHHPVRVVGTQLGDDTIGDHFVAKVQVFSRKKLLATFTEKEPSGRRS
jgi:hypothetical protein